MDRNRQVEVAKMSKYIYPEDGISTVTFKKQSELSYTIANQSPWPTVVTRIQVDAPAIERIKISCDNLMQEVGSKLLRWSHILK
jgi:hypothetical protein